MTSDMQVRIYDMYRIDRNAPYGSFFEHAGVMTETVTNGHRVYDRDFDPAEYTSVKRYETSVVRNRTSLVRDPTTRRLIGYKGRKLLGEYIAPTFYSRHKKLKSTGRVRSLGYGWQSQGAPSLSGLTTNAELFANRNFYASLNRRNDLELGVFLVELKQSLGLVSKTIYTFVDIIRALKRGRVTDAIEILQQYHNGNLQIRGGLRNRSKKSKISKSDYVASTWLELQFGWKPLLKDLYDIMNLLSQRRDDDALPWFKIRGFGEDSATESWSDSKGSYTRSVHERVSYNSHYTIVNEPLDMLNAFGLDDPLSIAWEVVPFSFVFDWFLPVGNWIQAQSADSGLELLGFSRSTKKTWSSRADYDDGFSAAGTLEEFMRTPLSEAPSYQLRFVNPIDLVDGWHIMTSLALIQRVFIGK